MGDMAPEVEAKLRRSFAAQSLMETFAADLVRIAPGEVEIAAPIVAGARQQHGYGHAGLTFTLGDTAAGYAALTLMPREAEVLTIEMKINLLSPALGDRLLAIGRVVRPGRRVIVVSSEVMAERDGTSHPIALLQGTMIPV